MVTGGQPGCGRARAFGMLAALAVMAACLTKTNPDWAEADGAAEPSTGSAGGATATGTTGSSSTAAGVTTDGSPDGSGGSTTGVTAGRCDGVVTTEEPFVSLPVTGDGWWVVTYPGISPRIEDDVMHVGVNVPSGQSYWLMGRDEPATTRGTIGFEVVSPPIGGLPLEMYIGLRDDARLLHFDVNADWIWIDLWDGTQGAPYEEGPYDPTAHRWLRMVFDLDVLTVVFETSADGETWDVFGEVDASMLDIPTTRVQIGIGVWMGPVETADAAAIDNLFLCEGAASGL